MQASRDGAARVSKQQKLGFLFCFLVAGCASSTNGLAGMDQTVYKKTHPEKRSQKRHDPPPPNADDTLIGKLSRSLQPDKYQKVREMPWPSSPNPPPSLAAVGRHQTHPVCYPWHITLPLHDIARLPLTGRRLGRNAVHEANWFACREPSPIAAPPA